MVHKEVFQRLLRLSGFLRKFDFEFQCPCLLIVLGVHFIGSSPIARGLGLGVKRSPWKGEPSY